MNIQTSGKSSNPLITLVIFVDLSEFTTLRLLLFLVAYAFSFKLSEPALGDGAGDFVYDPLWYVSHNVKVVDEEDVSDFAVFWVLARHEDKGDRIALPTDPRSDFWHLFCVRDTALRVKGHHSGLRIVLTEVFLDVEVAVGHCWWRLEGIINTAVPQTRCRVEDFEIVQIGIPSTAPFVINGSFNHCLEARLHRKFHLLHVDIRAGRLCPPKLEQLVIEDSCPLIAVPTLVQFHHFCEVNVLGGNNLGRKTILLLLRCTVKTRHARHERSCILCTHWVWLRHNVGRLWNTLGWHTTNRQLFSRAILAAFALAVVLGIGRLIVVLAGLADSHHDVLLDELLALPAHSQNL